jgi:site-specific recombinase XerD
LLEQDNDIRTVQELSGHASIETTQIYSHVLQQGVLGIASPVDR